MGQILIIGFAIPYFYMGRDRPGFGEMIPYLSLVWGPSSNKSVLVCFYSSDFCFLLWLQVEGFRTKADSHKISHGFVVIQVHASLHVCFK